MPRNICDFSYVASEGFLNYISHKGVWKKAVIRFIMQLFQKVITQEDNDLINIQRNHKELWFQALGKRRVSCKYRGINISPDGVLPLMRKTDNMGVTERT